jgi:hypothetical protein
MSTNEHFMRQMCTCVGNACQSGCGE